MTLEQLRDAWCAAARTLITDFGEATPAQELGGILGRAASLLESLAAHLEALEDLELSGPERDPEAIELALLSVHRIPRCVQAFAKELERAEEDRSWSSLTGRATQLRRALRGLQHAWLLREMGVDLTPSLPNPPLESLARLGQAARLEQLGRLLGEAPEGTSSDEHPPL